MRRSAAIGAALALLVAGTAMSPGKAAATDAGGWHLNATTGHWYALVGNMGWLDAEEFAVTNGGYLVTINDEAEQSWLHDTFAGESLAIGFSDYAVEGDWVWASGEPTTYLNWCNGEPNNANDGESFAAMNWQPSGCWNDLPGTGIAIIEAQESFPLPTTLALQAEASHYLGGDWEHQISLLVSCDGFEQQEIWMDLPGMIDDVLGPMDQGTSCSTEVGYLPEPGENASWNEPIFTPGPDIVLGQGANVVTVDLPRVWDLEWPPPDEDTFDWHDMTLTVNKVNLNSKGGIEVEGTASCPDGAEVMTGEFEGDVYHSTQWSALQYVGRRTAIHAGYDSAIADLCWRGDGWSAGPFGWKTRYPNGTVQYVYGTDGKFAGGTIHIEATASAEVVLVTQNFAPEGWQPFGEEYVVPYDEGCTDNNGDGWCVAHHQWEGFAGADLRTTKVK